MSIHRPDTITLDRTSLKALSRLYGKPPPLARDAGIYLHSSSAEESSCILPFSTIPSLVTHRSTHRIRARRHPHRRAQKISSHAATRLRNHHHRCWHHRLRRISHTHESHVTTTPYHGAPHRNGRQTCQKVRCRKYLYSIDIV